MTLKRFCSCLYQEFLFSHPPLTNKTNAMSQIQEEQLCQVSFKGIVSRNLFDLKARTVGIFSEIVCRNL